MKMSTKVIIGVCVYIALYISGDRFLEAEKNAVYEEAFSNGWEKGWKDGYREAKTAYQ